MSVISADQKAAILKLQKAAEHAIGVEVERITNEFQQASGLAVESVDVTAHAWRSIGSGLRTSWEVRIDLADI